MSSFDPFAADFHADPYPAYARQRAAHRVEEHPLGFWVLWHHGDVEELLRARHSVEYRNVEARPTPLRAVLTEAFGDSPQARRGDGLSMLDRDPPDHTRLRRLVAKAFTPRTVAELTPRVEALVEAALARMAQADEVDLIAALAFPLPFQVISDLLGLPADDTDTDRLRELSHLVVQSLEPVLDPQRLRDIHAADLELGELVGELVAWKRAHPGPDLLTGLLAAEEDGDVLSDDELVAQVALLYLAGHETTVNLIGNATLALLRHPDQLAVLRDDPGVVANAVEELLRYDSPVQLSRRITLAEHRVGDTVLPAGAFVIASLASANRDPAVFGPDADRLDLTRANARAQLSFGSGVHHCLGAALARLEGAAALRGLAVAFPALALGGEPDWNGRINLRGARRLPVRPHG